MQEVLSRNRFLMVLSLVIFVAVAAGCAQVAAPSPTAAPAKSAPASSTAPTAQPSTAKSSTPAAKAPTEIKVGVLYPLTGGAAPAGLEGKYGAELAAEIANSTYDLNLPLAKTEGLPNLSGAKVTLVFSDHQGSPEKGQSETERLITQEKVAALMGAYHSSVTQTAGQTAERLGVPILNAESSSPALTEKGFKYFFRTTAPGPWFVSNLFDLVDDVKKQKGATVKTVGIVNENTLYGSDFNKAVKETARIAGLRDRSGFIVSGKHDGSYQRGAAVEGCQPGYRPSGILHV